MDSEELDIDKLQARLLKIGVDVPQATLRRWAYDKREIIPRPERYKRGPRSGKSGRAAKWSEEAFLQAAAVWAVLNSPRTMGHLPLSIIPDIKSAAKQPYESPLAGYVLSAELSADLKSQKEITYKSIEVQLAHGESRGKEPAEWQVLLRTWIAAKEKAKRGKRIDTPQQVRFHWRSVKKDDGVDYDPENVNGDNVSLQPSESGHDEIVIIIDGNDMRKTVARIFGFSKEP